MKGTLYNPLYIRLQAGFSQWLRILNFEPSSPRDMPKILTEFLVWLQDNNCHRPHDIQQEHLKRYMEHLHERPSKTAAGAISLNYIRKHLQVIRKFSRYLTESGQESFTVKLRIKGKSTNVKCILTPAEISSLYDAVKDDTLGLRDKAILALYYGCGLRKNEGANINVKDILLDKELVYVRKGKGYKERYVPLAGSGKADLENYILYGRPLLAADKKEDALLLNVNGTRLSGHMAYERLQKLKVIARIKKPAGLHTLRHSIASHLLHSGMALEQIQRFLGHSSMESTQIYTHLQHEQKYNFTPAIQAALKSYQTYLQQEQYAKNYIRQNSNYAGVFLEWMEEESLTTGQVTHADVLEFADQLKQKDYSIRLINRVMLAIRYYFNWLTQNGQAAYNPAAGIILKGTIRHVPHDLLSQTELEALYESYPVTDGRTHRNKVITGLLVYQALTRDELETLRPEHLKLREGKINIPATGRLNSRVLVLQPHQILDLQEYVLAVRPKILAERMAERSGRKPDKYKAVEDIQRLFVNMNGQETMKNSLLHLNYALRKINPKYKHGTQIRQSVITEWLKEKNLRTVQYMAGHRYISSTERYKTSNLEDLKDALNKHHPLNLS